ncbi:hypothetical protein CCR75_001133 [Bremia lactucae]|uniref:Uncharacterized protein n=1 Tax=Bremia lactucae TaxID=4779 RepID=A0A976P0G2_BRELC|nr:hypothetical protein CCR75_001133 [Bremia lactucae]
MSRLTFISSLALLVTSCKAQIRANDEICVMGDFNYCPVDDLTPSALDRSIVILPGGATRCAFDDFSVPGANYTTNSTYFFQVFPAPSKTKLMLYFQGGGACVDEATCSFGVQCMFQTFNANARPLSNGVLDRSNVENVFNDYNIVHLPYCTGDLHVGSTMKSDFGSTLNSSLNRPECLGHNMSLHMVGYNNTMAVLEWAVTNYPNPEEIIISGYSAGAIGAQMVSGLVAEIWHVKEKNIRYSVLSDSYVGVMHNEEAAGKILSTYGMCDLDLKLTNSLQDACKQTTVSFTGIISHLITATTDVQWLFIQSMYDRDQRFYYQLQQDGITGHPFTNLVSGEDFYSKMMAMIDVYKNVSNDISTFYVNNSQHVFLTRNNYYYNATRTPSGELLGSFLKKWLVTDLSLDTVA